MDGTFDLVVDNVGVEGDGCETGAAIIPANGGRLKATGVPGKAVVLTKGGRC